MTKDITQLVITKQVKSIVNLHQNLSLVFCGTVNKISFKINEQLLVRPYETRNNVVSKLRDMTQQ